MTHALGRVAVDFGVLLVELAVLLVVVAGLLALAARRVGLVRLHGWLGGSRLAGAMKGILVGFTIPFCTYSAIPVFVAMVGAGARTATVAGFLLSAPVLDPVVLAVLALLFGWEATLAYAAVTFATVLAVALLADAAGVERQLRPPAVLATVPPSRRDPDRPHGAGRQPAGDALPRPTVCAPDPFTDPTAWQGWRAESRSAVAYAFHLARGLALPMVAAVALAAAIVGFTPDDLLARVAGPDDPLAVPTAALLGVPFYVSTEAFLPIAAALHDAGMGVGAVFALVISAAGVNLPELGLLSRLMTRRLLALYTAAVIGIAIAAGELIPWLL